MSQDRPVALITGASTGIGANFALQLAPLGYDLIICARRKEKLEELSARIIDSYGVEVELICLDLFTREGIETLEHRIDRCSRLEYLVNNAGFGTVGHFDQVELKKHLAMIDLHISVPVRLSYRAIPLMKQRGRGRIINVSSVGAFMPSSHGTIYNATKSFLNSFSTSLAMGLEKSGIKVQALCPGLTRTDFHFTDEFKGIRLHRSNNLIWMDPPEVVSCSIDKIENTRQIIVIPGVANKIIAGLLKNSLTGWFLARALYDK